MTKAKIIAKVYMITPKTKGYKKILNNANINADQTINFIFIAAVEMFFKDILFDKYKIISKQNLKRSY